MTLDDLRAFVAFVAHGSVSRAAQQLHLSQPALTRRIQHLESFVVNSTLLDRSVRPPRLSRFGMQVYEQAQTVLREAAALRELVHGNGEPQGLFRVGAVQSVSHTTAVTAVRLLKERFPKLRIEMHTDWSPELLKKARLGQLDVAAIMLPPQLPLPEGLVGCYIATEAMVVVAAKKHPVKRSTALKDLASYSWVLYPDRGCLCRAALQRAFEARGHALQVAVSDYSADQQLAQVSENSGLGLVPQTMLSATRYRNKLRTVSVKDLDIRFEIWVVWPAHPGPLAEPVECFAQAVAKQFASSNDVTVKRNAMGTPKGRGRREIGGSRADRQL